MIKYNEAIQEKEVFIRLYKKYLISIFLLFMLCFFGEESITAVTTAEGKRVLFISSYSYTWETVPQQMAGVQEAFGEQVTVDYKFMDTKNVSSNKSEELFYQSIRQYLSEVDPYDGIIVGDDAAFQFALAYRQELFSGIPIVYEGVNDIQQAEEASKDPIITGVVESLSYDNTLKFATELYPDADEIVAVLDNTITGESERKVFYSYEEKFPGLKFSEINATECSRQELADKIAGLGENTILLYVMCSMDKEGRAYTSQESVALVSSSAKIPTFSIVSIGMGCGILGGEIVSQDQMGYLAATMLKRYFCGKDMAEIDMVSDSPRQFCFDEDVMRRFGLKASQMPENSEFINHRETFVERNRQMIEIAAVVGVILIILLCVLAVDNIKRRKLNDDLKKAKAKLELAVHYDVLTKLRNRGVFMTDMQLKIDNGDEFAIILFDLDNFKNINDSLGHNNGDLVLKEIANRSKELEDIVFQVYRLAGDEFTAIVSTNHTRVVREYAKAIQGVFEKPFILEEKEYFLHSSIGIAMCPKDGATPKDIVAAADVAMYRVKNSGKDNIAFYREKGH